MRITGKWSKSGGYLTTASWHMPGNLQPAAVKKLDAMAALVKQSYPVLKGMNANISTDIRGGASVDNGPYPYTVDVYYFWYYYNTAYKKIIPADETGTIVHVEVNHPSFMLYPYKYNGKDQYIEANGKLHMVRELWIEDGSWKGYTVYRAPYKESSSSYTRSIIITKDGLPLWLPVSQLQYLQMLRKQEEKEMNKMITDLGKGDSALRNRMMVSVKKFSGERIKKIDEYIAKTSRDTLNQQAMLTLGDFLSHGFSKPTDQYKRRLVYFNPAYFNYKLPRNEPQFIVLRWSANMNYEPCRYFKEQFEANFDVQKLKSMLK